MDLASIKFNYLDKINSLDNRIEKYEDIIKKYTERIKKAEQEESPNISSVITAKEKYEHRIENMQRVKAYYQEFVDTSDYLLQNINKEKQFLLIEKCNDLEEKYEQSMNKNKELELKLNDAEEILKHQKLLYNYEKDKVQRLKKTNEIKLSDLTAKKANAEKQMREEIQSLKKYKRQLKKVVAENKMLSDTNEFLEKKVRKLTNSSNLIKRHDKLVEEISSLEKENASLKRINQDIVEYYSFKDNVPKPPIDNPECEYVSEPVSISEITSFLDENNIEYGNILLTNSCIVFDKLGDAVSYGDMANFEDKFGVDLASYSFDGNGHLVDCEFDIKSFYS